MGDPRIPVPPDIEAKLKTLPPRKQHLARDTWIKRRIAERSLVKQGQETKDAVFDALRAGRFSFDEMIEATGAEIEAKMGNATPIVDDNDRTIGFKFHNATTGRDHEWNVGPVGERYLEHRDNEFKHAARQREGSVSPVLRGEAAHKFTLEGEANRFREALGAENVKVLDDEIFVNEGGGFIPVDRRSAIGGPAWLQKGGLKELGADLLETVPTLHEVVPGVVAGIAGSPLGPAGVATVGGAADALGTAQRMNIAGAIPGAEAPGFDTAARIGHGATNVAAGLVGEGAGALGGKVIGRFVDGPVQKQIAGEFSGDLTKAQLRGKMIDARNLEARLTNGLPRGEDPFEFTLGQVTGAREGLGREKILRQAGGAPDKMAAKAEQQARALEGHFERTINALTSGRATEGAGPRIAGAYKGHLKALKGSRRMMSGPHFDAAESAAGGRPVIALTNTEEAIAQAIKEQEGALQSDTAIAITNKLKGELERLRGGAEGDGPTLATVRGLQNSLRDLGRVEGGTGQFIKDLDRANDQRVAGNLKRAMLADLDAAAEGGGPGAESLLKARNAWAKGSAKIDAARNKFLDGLVKTEDLNAVADGLYDFPEKMLFGRNPQAIRDTVRKVAAADPEALADMQGRALQKMLEKGETNQGGFSPARLSRFFLKKGRRARLEALLDSTPDGKSALMALDDIGRAIKMMTAASDVPGGSQSVPFLLKMAAMKQSGIPLVSHAVGGISETIGRALSPLSSPQGIADHVTDPRKRELVLMLVRPKPTRTGSATKRLTRAANQLIALQNRGETVETVREEGPGLVERAGRAVGHQLLPGLIDE